MRNAILIFIFCLCASLLVNLGGIGVAYAMPATKLAGKNFVFYVDISGSMSMSYHEKQSSKIDVAVKLLHAINDEMPDMDANVGFYTYGPHLEYRRVTPFDRDQLRGAIRQLPTDIPFSGRPTPMSAGIQNLDTTIAALPGNVAFIVITDGESNFGDPPAEVIQDAYARHGNRLCFHFISFAKNSDEKALVKKLSDLSACSVTAEAVDLLDESVRADFIAKVFGQ